MTIKISSSRDDRRELNDMSQVIAVMIVIIIIGIVVDRLFFVKGEKRIRERWAWAKS